MQQADAKAGADVLGEVASASENWSVFSSGATTEAPRKLDDAKVVTSAPVDVAPVKYSERQVKKVLADTSEASSESWAVFRAEAATDAMQQADAKAGGVVLGEVAAENWSVFSSGATTEAPRKLDDAKVVSPAVDVGPVKYSERQVKKVLADASDASSESWAVFRAEAATDGMKQADAKAGGVVLGEV